MIRSRKPLLSTIMLCIIVVTFFIFPLSWAKEKKDDTLDRSNQKNDRSDWLLGKIEPVLEHESQVEEELRVIVYIQSPDLHAVSGKVKSRLKPEIGGVAEQIRAIEKTYRPKRSLRPEEEKAFLMNQKQAVTAEDRAELKTLRGELDTKLDGMKKEVGFALKQAVKPNQDQIADFITANGGVVTSRVAVISALGATIPSSLLLPLAEHPLVMSIMKDGLPKPQLNVSIPTCSFSTWWNNGFDGGVFDFGIVDTGVQQDHPAFSNVNFYTNSGSSSDADGHGTHITGIVASANTSYRGGAYGLDAVIWSIGTSQVDDMADMEWQADSAVQAPEVINSSQCYIVNPDPNEQDPNTCVFSTDPDYTNNDAFYDAFIEHYEIMISKAAGNGGWGGGLFPLLAHPAHAYNLLSVANMDDQNTSDRTDDVREDSSSTGPTSGKRNKPDITAPGTNIWSCNNDWADTNARDFVSMSGTSMAAPHVAAAILLLEDGGNHRPMAQKAVLINTADAWNSNDTQPTNDDGPVNGSHWDVSYGWGYLDMWEAYYHRNDYFEDSVVPNNNNATPDDYKLYYGDMNTGDKATLVWEKRAVYIAGYPPASQHTLSNLDLKLYDEADGSLEDYDTDSNDNVHQVAASSDINAVIKVYFSTNYIVGATEEPYALATEENFSEADPPSFDISLSVPPSVNPDTEFTVTATITNNGDVVAHNNSATLTLPSGFSITSGSNPQDIGTIYSTDQATWIVRAPSTSGPYDLSASNTSSCYGETYTDSSFPTSITVTSSGLDCTNAVTLTSGVDYNGTTVGAPSNVSTYDCSGWNESGPEVVHTITTTATGDITATLSNLQSVDLDVFILSACDSNNCEDYGDNTVTYTDAPAGTYYIIVDGYNGASGSYTLNVTAPSICDSPECEALETLYNDTDGDNWTNNSGWLQTNTPCSWYGVTCSGEGNVIRLALLNNQLNGTIPSEIGHLSQLEYLNLGENQLNGSIPPAVGNLSQLQELRLYENQLSESIPPELGNLEQLQLLDLYDNQLSENIPSELGDLDQLQYLYLRENPLSGSLPANLINLTLQRFYFDNTELCEPQDTEFQSWLTSIPDMVGTGVACTSSGIIYVDVDATGANNGTSWIDAYTDLQAALSVAQSGDEIWVAEGIYKPSEKYGGNGDRNKSFQMKNGVGIYGGFAGDETNLGQRDWMSNFTILSGDIGAQNVSSDNSYHVFYHPNGTNLDSTAILDGFIITSGKANDSSSHNSGGGMSNSNSSPTLINCTFSGNSANSAGGGMNNFFSSPTLINCTFYDNWSSYGGGMFNSFSSPTLINCTFSRNSASSNGGGMYNSSDSSTPSPTLTNCIFWGDIAPTGSEIFNTGCSPTITYCDIQGWNSGGTGNINADPSFEANGDFHLQAGSPCIDAGNNSVLNLPTTDFEGDARIIDGNNDGDPIVDMGVDEALPSLDCTNAVTLTSGSSYNGTTVGAPSNVSTYDCSGWNESGPEVVHTLTTNATGDITVTLSDLSVDLDVFILSACDSNNCEDYGDSTITYTDAPAGTYYIVVDGYDGVSGSYTLTVTSTIPPFCDTVIEIPANECEALVSVYTSTDGDNWTNNSGWLQSNTPCNSWYGVTCSGENVIELDLQSNQLNGSIPSELGHLSQLQSLYLHFNQLSGPLPASLTNLALYTFYFIQTDLCEPQDSEIESWLASIPDMEGTGVVCPSVQPFAVTYGSPDWEWADSIQQTSDGGYIVAGTYSPGTDAKDIWILKLDSSGIVSWQKTYGGSEDDDWAESIQQTSDGGYIVAGITESFGVSDIWLLKLDSNGIVVWQKTYSSSGEVSSVQQTNDGGYIVAGYFRVSGGRHIWILKVDRNGDVNWQKTYGGPEFYERAYFVQQTADGGYIVAAKTDLSGDNYYDVWILKLDSSGSVSWQKTYGSSGTVYSIQQTSDGGYIMAGSFSIITGGIHIWVVKLDSNGTIIWQKTYGRSERDWAEFIQQTSDGGYIVAAKSDFYGNNDYSVWLLKLDSSGSISWQKIYGGSEQDGVESIQQTSDGGYILTGHTTSFGPNFNDIWLLKLDENGTIPGCSLGESSTAQISDTTATDIASYAGTTVTNATITPTNATTDDTSIQPNFICDPTIQPEINIKQDTTEIPSGTGSYDFGTGLIGTSISVTFTIENSGPGILEMTSSPIVNFSSNPTGDFAITQQPVTDTIAPGATSTFKVTFTPSDIEQRTATVSIANTDNDENPYTFTVTGTGVQDSNSFILWTK